MFIEHVKGKEKINLITSLHKQCLEAARQARLGEVGQVLCAALGPVGAGGRREQQRALQGGSSSTTAPACVPLGA